MIGKYLTLLSTVFLLFLQTQVQAAPRTKSQINGLVIGPPLLNIKDGFVVNDKESGIVKQINDASTSIAYFIKEISDPLHEVPLESELKHALPSARQSLRLPPMATGGIKGRYVNMQVYCWNLIDHSHLQARIEWADFLSKDRYLDSYIFEKHEGKWLFVGHGDYGPVHWLQKDKYSAPPCEK